MHEDANLRDVTKWNFLREKCCLCHSLELSQWTTVMRYPNEINNKLYYHSNNYKSERAFAIFVLLKEPGRSLGLSFAKCFWLFCVHTEISTSPSMTLQTFVPHPSDIVRKLKLK